MQSFAALHAALGARKRPTLYARYAHLLQVGPDRDIFWGTRRSERLCSSTQDGDSYKAVAISDQFDSNGSLELPADSERPSRRRGFESRTNTRRALGPRRGRGPRCRAGLLPPSQAPSNSLCTSSG